MKVEIQGYVVATKYSWNDKPVFGWMPHDPSSYDDQTAVVCAQAITVDVPDDFDFRKMKIAEAQRKVSAVQAEYTKKINDAMARLRAIRDVDQDEPDDAERDIWESKEQERADQIMAQNTGNNDE